MNLPYYTIDSLICLAVFFGVNALWQTVPDPATVASASGKFKVLEAWQHLKDLTQVGPRVHGSAANEIASVNLLRDKLEQVSANSQRYPIEIQHQIANGSFRLGSWGTFHYQQVQNVIARIRLTKGALDGSQTPALLLNCHFDSVPLSPGASDDGVQCAILIEVLSALSKLEESQVFHHDVIVLFNGAEETILRASHAFITQHPWAKDITMFMNLEAAGAGGREVLFQSGPGNMWILDTYLAAAPHPSATVVAQEIFQNGIIPSDTDFRIFRDYGNISGIDMAYVHNGYVYHTKYDSTDNIAIGAILRCGENVLEVARSLAALNPADLTDNRLERTPVYFELLGSLAVSYPIWVGSIINLAACMLCVAVVFRKLAYISKKTDLTILSLSGEMLLIFIGRLVSLVIGVTWAIGTAKILEMANHTMAWFDSLYLLFFLYVMPIVVADILVTKTFEKFMLNWWPANYGFDSRSSGLIFMSVHLTFVLLTMVGTYSNIASTFLPMFFVLFPLFGTLLCKSADSIRTALFTALPIACCSYIVVVLIPFFAAIQGRSGVSKNPDMSIGIASSVFAFIILSYSSAKIPKDKFALHLAAILSFAWAVLLLAILLTPLGFPYTKEHQVKRYRVLHTVKTAIKNDVVVSKCEGIAIAEEDFHWVDLTGIVPNYENRVMPTNDDCREELNCGHPFRRRWESTNDTSRMYWVSAKGPTIPENLRLEVRLLSSQDLGEGLKRLTFHIRGPSNIDVIVSPNGQIDGWSFADGYPGHGGEWKDGRSAFTVGFTKGGKEAAMDGGLEAEFWIIVKDTTSVTLAATGHIQHGSSDMQRELRDFVGHFPEWAFPAAWTVEYKSYEMEL